jgi:hypothetical protein
LLPCSFGLSANSQQYFSLRTNQPATTIQQYFYLRTNQHQSSATSHPNKSAMGPKRPLSLAHEGPTHTQTHWTGKDTQPT